MNVSSSHYITEPEIKLPAMRSARVPKLDESELIHKMNVRDLQFKLLQHQNRAWLKRHGKNNYLGFNPLLRQELKGFFASLDEDGSGAVSIEELYEPLLALGLVENKDQVQILFRKVDADSSGVIEFNEFMQVLEEAGNRTGSALSEMVRTLVDQREHLPFKLRISNARRRMMLTAYGPDEHRPKGQMVLKAFEAELSLTAKGRSKLDKLVDKKRMEIQRENRGRRRQSQEPLPEPSLGPKRPVRTRKHNLSSIM